MGDVDDGGADALVQRAQLDLHGFAQLLVERGQRFVHQDQPRLEDHGACERHALALAAGELRDTALFVAGKTDHRKRRAHLIRPGRLRQPSRAQGKGNILADAHMREQRVVLEHDADIALVRRHPGDVAAAEQDRSARWQDEAAEDAEQRRLAGAGGAEQGDELAGGDIEGHVVEGANGTIGLARGSDLDAFRSFVQRSTSSCPEPTCLTARHKPAL
ncbi:hypothetical protein ACVWZV_003488 [Bradyrhizobium sp. GM5.1]